MEDPARDRLLLRAEEAFLAKGYRAAKLSEIALAAGISKKTIYRYVDSKEALFALVVEEALAGSLHPASLIDDGGDAAKVLYDFLQPFAQLALSERGTHALKMVLSEAFQFPDLAQRYFASIRATVMAPLAAWLNRQSRAGRLIVDDAAMATEMLLAMVVSERSQRIALGLEGLPSTAVIDSQLRAAIGVFLNGVAPAVQDRPAEV
jgi:AcrR family transcriptional regulator